MKWTVSEPQYGDMIRVKAGKVLHYGIYVSDEEVIQFGESPILGVKSAEEIVVLATNIDAFLQGEFLEVVAFDKKEQKRKNAADKIVEIARMRIGEKGYHILRNNCEHFAYECVFGVHKSEQAEKAIVSSLQPIVDVYYAPLCKKIKLRSITPIKRRLEIENCSNEKVRLEKYSVWKLLAYAIKKSFGLKSKKLNFQKKENGQWVCDNCFFSLTHSENIVAVAVSNYPIGVDVEKVKSHSEEVAKKVLTNNELQEFLRLDKKERVDFFIQKWTQKESVYKQNGAKTFEPRKIESFNGESKIIELNGQQYGLSVASDKIQELRVFSDIRVK